MKRKKNSVCRLAFLNDFVEVIIPIFILLAEVFGALDAYAQDDDTNKFEELIQEFFLSEAVYVQEKGEFQATSHNTFFTYESLYTLTPSVEFEYGVLDRFQMNAGVSYHIISPVVEKTVRGLGNLEVGAFYNLVQTDKFSASMLLEVELPTGKKEVADEKMGFEPGIILAGRVGRGQIHTGIIAGISNETELQYNIAGIYPFHIFHGILEVNGFFEKGKGTSGENSIFLTPGLIWNRLEMLELGLGIPVTIVGENSDFGLIFFIALEVG